MNIVTDKRIEPIAAKVIAGERLSPDDGIRLLESPDLIGIGRLADKVRRAKNGDRAYFISNRHINHTNVCVNQCRFCAFAVRDGEEGGYTMQIEEAVKAARPYAHGVTEFHIVGGLHPSLPYEYYLGLISRLHEEFPAVHLQAFTAVEIEYLSRLAGKSVRDVLLELKSAGLGSMPGGGAEIFAARCREKICPEKISGDEWLNVMRTAHSVGLKSNATMLYGHIETNEERVDHMVRLRALQDETGGFMTFIPLAFHPKNTKYDSFSRTTGALDLRMLAVSRLMLDNFPHIKSFWIMVGQKLAQLSLLFGVDDIDGTVVEEKITHAAGAEAGMAMTKTQIVSLIREAGLVPVERDTVYGIVEEYSAETGVA